MAGFSLRRRVIGAAALACLALVGIAGIVPADAQPVDAQPAAGHMTINPSELSASRQVDLGLGKSLVIDLPRDAKDVLVSNPTVADAVMRTARRAYLIGQQVGQTNVFFFDAAGRQIAILEVNVGLDTAVLAQQIRQLVPGSSVRVEAINDNIVLSGTVRTPADAVKAFDIAGRFAGDPAKVLNMIASEGSEQVFLKVTVAEMTRETVKQFGVNLDIATLSENFATSIITDNVFALGAGLTPALDAVLQWTDGENSVAMQIEALEQHGLVRVLAEPTLSAISGESASFLVGGEFPVPVGYDQDTNTVTIEYKPFGVSLNFTPVVMSGGRISLKVKTEVSELTNDSAVTVGPITVPGLNVRRADTTVELPSGGSLVLAGLLQQETKQALNGVPGIMDVPILGALFRSRDYQNDETELVVLATPYLSKPVPQKELVRPDKNFSPATDPATILLGRLNKLYGYAETNPAGNYRGPIGFIVE